MGCGSGGADHGGRIDGSALEVGPIDRLFELPAAIQLRGSDRQVEQLIERGRHGRHQAALRIARLILASPLAGRLLGVLRRPLPPWLADGRQEPQALAPTGSRPPPYLASFFYPSRPEVPKGFETVGEAIQRGRYEEAARQLVSRWTADPTTIRQLVVVAAECWLLADRPEAAEPLLHHRLPPAGTWALACAHVQQNHLNAALTPLASLARRGALTDERQAAAAVLVAHLGLDRLPDDLEALSGHPYLVQSQAQAAGHRRFVEKSVREIGRQRSAESVSRIVARVVADCESIPVDDARNVLAATYEAAVRATSRNDLAERGLRLFLSHPELMGRDEAECSRALLFATASDRLEELHQRLQERALGPVDREVEYSCWLTAAKLSLVQDDVVGIEDHAARAAAAATSPTAEARAARLRLAARRLASGSASRVSDWQLRQLHHLLPEPVAERLEDRDGLLLPSLDGHGTVSSQAQQSLRAAAAQLQAVVAVARDMAALPRLRAALGTWAYHVGAAMVEAGWPDSVELAAYTAAARSLLGPEPPSEVVAAHARAAADLTDEQLVIGLRPAASAPPAGLLDALAGSIESMENMPDGERASVERCLADRWALLPDEPPFRGRRWFTWDEAHRKYAAGRRSLDATVAARAFEDAWRLEPNNHVTIQGLVLGLTRRLREQPRRRHILDRLAGMLDEMADREVEAALAHRCLARLAGPGSQDWRTHLERAGAALGRRIHRQPWPRARNAQVAIQLELGDLAAAGEAAWEESCQWLPGSEISSQYARLAAALWQQACQQEQRLDDRVCEALHRAAQPRLTNREAVEHAVAGGRLLALTGLRLDYDSLEDLWRACRGDEDDLCRFLEKQGTREVDGRPWYLDFMARKLEHTNAAAAARVRNWYLAPDAAVDPSDIAWLRLAAAELLTHDPLSEVAVPRGRLGESHLREFMASLRACAGDDQAAYTTFAAAVEDALATLFELRQAVSLSDPQPHSARLARASEAIEAVRRAGPRFGTRAVARIAGLVGDYLALALDGPAVEAYLRDKEHRLVPSRLGLRLGDWWARLVRCAGPLDFFHHHHYYRYPGHPSVDEWWRSHRVLGVPVREAVEHLAASLAAQTEELRSVERSYRSTRLRPDQGLSDFGLVDELARCGDVLRSALGPGAHPEQARLIEDALRGLGESLRRCEVARLSDGDGVVTESSLPLGCYLLPRAPELLSHWQRNVGAANYLLAIFEVRDNSGHEVLCMACLDAESRPVPRSVPLRGLSPFADMVDALGGQLHLWIARPGQRAGCRRIHDDGRPCAADDYVERIDRRLGQLAEDHWRSRSTTLQPWLRVIDNAVRSEQNATLAFAILPRLHE